MKLLEVIRKSLGFQQAELAKALGVTRTYYSEIETNRRKAGKPTQKALEEFFGLPASVLLEDKNLIPTILKMEVENYGSTEN